MKDHWRDVPPGPDPPETVHGIIEIPKGGRNKYEYSKQLGDYVLDRVLHSPLSYPGEYGFIPQTLYDDGDPMDIIVLLNERTFPGCIIRARPIGLLRMIDSGEQDDKILSVACDDPHHEGYKDLSDVPEPTRREIVQFFETYKDLDEGKDVTVEGWSDRQAAREATNRSIQIYRDD